MTNGISLVLGLIVLALLGADIAMQDGAASLFLARRFFSLLDWIAFWR